MFRIMYKQDIVYLLYGLEHLFYKLILVLIFSKVKDI